MCQLVESFSSLHGIVSRSHLVTITPDSTASHSHFGLLGAKTGHFPRPHPAPAPLSGVTRAARMDSGTPPVLAATATICSGAPKSANFQSAA